MNKIIGIIIIVIVVLAIFMGISITLYNGTFGHRYDVPNTMYDVVKERNPNINRAKVNFESEGNKLTGYFYYNDNIKNYDSYVIVAHGIGNNHVSKLPEMLEFIKNGYLVFAYDNTGVGESEGENLVGLSHSVIDLESAINYTASLDYFKDKNLFLFGHSWGGYAVSAVGNLNIKKEPVAIAAMAGFNESISPLKTTGKKIVGPLVYLFEPFIKVYERFILPNSYNLTGINGFNNIDSDVLILHSKDDSIVEYENYEQYYNAFKDNERFKFLTYDTQTHRVNMKNENIKKLDELYEKKIEKEKNKEYESDADIEYNNYLLDSLDINVMDDIIIYFNDALGKDKNAL